MHKSTSRNATSRTTVTSSPLSPTFGARTIPAAPAPAAPPRVALAHHCLRQQLLQLRAHEALGAPAHSPVNENWLQSTNDPHHSPKYNHNHRPSSRRLGERRELMPRAKGVVHTQNLAKGYGPHRRRKETVSRQWQLWLQKRQLIDTAPDGRNRSPTHTHTSRPCLPTPTR